MARREPGEDPKYIAAMSGRGIAFLTFHLIYNCLISRHPYRGGSDVEDSG